MCKSNFPTCGRAGQKSRMEFLQQFHGYLSHDAEDCLMTRSIQWNKRGNS